MSIQKLFNKLKVSSIKRKSNKNEKLMIDELGYPNTDINTPFIFKYNSICPAISIILLDRDILNTPNRFNWLCKLFVLFNISMNTDKYKIEEIDLKNPNKLFKTTFGHDLFKKSKEISYNPVLWGKYIWALLHIVSLFWTPETNSIIINLLENVNYILPCSKCQIHYSQLINENKTILNNLSSLSSAVNFVINLREITNKKVYNRLPDGNYSFLEIYNYITPLVEPIDTYTNNKNSTHIKCSCNKQKKLTI